MIIKHLGKEVETTHFDGNIDYDIVNYIRNNYYKEDKDLAIKQLHKVLLEHKSKTNFIYNYYFQRLANDTIVDYSKWSINQALQSDELVQMMYNKTLKNDKIFTSKDAISNFNTAIRLGGKGYFKKATQFPIKVMRQLLGEFTEPNDIYYDPCCGWGMRMLVSAEKGLKYIGNDINLDLVDKLNEMGNDINEIKKFNYGILPQGSEIYIPQLENKVDFIFTSPPYFDLEVYNGSENLNNINYEMWLSTFIKPMLENCYKYIKQNKCVLINIKNGKKNMLYDDTLEIAEQVGFIFEGERDLKQNNRTHVTKKHGDSSEKIMVLKKL